MLVDISSGFSQADLISTLSQKLNGSKIIEPTPMNGASL